MVDLADNPRRAATIGTADPAAWDDRGAGLPWADGDVVVGPELAADRRIAVLGLGYVGLPLAIALQEAGRVVRGIDAAPAKVAQLLAGRSPVDDVSDARLVRAMGAGMAVATADDARLEAADAIIVCVPTPITKAKDPDLGPMLAAARQIRDALQPGQLIILQSTTFPGTTTGPFRAVLEERGLRAGVDFDLAYSPERVNPGDTGSVGRSVPRLVGGTTPRATRRAAALLTVLADEVVELSSPDAAELAKVLENSFRLVNIAFVNQLALLCERLGLDAWEVIDAAATKPFGFMRFNPGPGVGGHCIPVDPYYLSWRARELDFVDRFVELAGEVNLGMPRHVVDLVAEALNERGRAVRGARMAVLGVAFKPNVQDARNAPAAAVIAMLAARGADVRYHDPHVPSFRDADGVPRESHELPELLEWAEVVVILTGHERIDWNLVFESAGLIVDAVGASHRRRVRRRQVLKLGAGWS